MPKSWDAPPGWFNSPTQVNQHLGILENETEALNFGGTISYIDFDTIPIRIYPDMVKNQKTDKMQKSKKQSKSMINQHSKFA